MLKAEVSVPVALGTAALTYAAYNNALPSLADSRSIEPDNGHLASAERQALLTAVGVSAAVSLISKDPLPFILGSGLAVALSWYHRWNNHVDPMSGRLVQSDVARRTPIYEQS